jgi:hypothetical protein
MSPYVFGRSSHGGRRAAISSLDLLHKGADVLNLSLTLLPTAEERRITASSSKEHERGMISTFS